MNFLKILTIVCIFLCLNSCKSSGEKQEPLSTPEQITIEDIIAGAEAISPQIGNFNDVFNMLNMVEAPYFPVLCNDPSLVRKYLQTDHVAAANLGVYVSDLIYHMYGNDREQVAIMFHSAQELADSLDIGEAFSDTFRNNLEQKIITRDSLILAFNQLLASSEKYHTEEERIHLHSAFLAGLLIEKLYITSSLLNEVTHTAVKPREDVVNGQELLVIFKNQLVSAESLINTVLKQEPAFSGLFGRQELLMVLQKTDEFELSLHEILSDEHLGPKDLLTDLHASIRSLREQVVSAG